MAREFYEDIAQADWQAADLPRTRVALELIRPLRVADALDVGCGEGDVAVEIQRLSGARVAGVDISQRMVDTARGRGIEAHLVDLATDSLPFADGSFDLVYMAEVIEHLVRPDKALEEIKRVLRPGGHLVLSTPNLACLPNRLLLAFGLLPLYAEVSEETVLGRGLSALGQGGRPVGHLRLHTRRSLVEMLQLHGFTVQQVRGAPFSTDRFSVLQRLASRVSSLGMILVVLAEVG